MEYRKIKNKNKSDLVVDQFIKAILEGKYAPGDRVPIESELATNFGVSRITIREAFQKLSLMGLVDIREGRGTYISQPDVENYMNPLIPMLALQDKDATVLFEARIWLEIGLASLAAKYATDEEIKGLEVIHQTMVNNFSKNEHKTSVYSFSDQRFHEALSEMSHNEIMIKMYKTVQDIYRSHIAQISTMPEGRKSSLLGHGKILKAIKARDSNAAEETMRDHILRAFELFKLKQKENDIDVAE